MEPYKLDVSLDANKVFLVKRSELENRMDPNPYSKDRVKAIKSLAKNNQLLKLKDVIKSNKTVAKDISSEDIYIGLENIISDTGEYIETSEKDSISSANTFKKGQILFPKLRPYLNKVYYTEFDGLCSTEFHVFESKTKDFDTEFLSIYLRLSLIVNQTKHLMTGNTLPRLQTSDIENLPIPKIGKETQQQIVDIYNNAYAQKQAKVAEAKKLLASIDNYLLNELGITLPEKDNSLEARIFTTNFSEVAGGRLDPDYNSKIDYLLSQKANYNLVEFKTLLLKNPQYGANEEAVDIITADEYIRYIRITDIDEIGELKNEKLKSANNTDDRYLLNYNDLLFARSGSVGKCYIHKNTLQPAIFAGYLIRFLVDSAIANPNFIFYYCNSSIYKFWVSAIERPAVQSNINSEEFKKMPIPLPPIEKQNEIADYIAGIRAGAKRLQEEAVNILDNAKHQVEQIILG